jgi:hypothetical protein
MPGTPVREVGTETARVVTRPDGKLTPRDCFDGVPLRPARRASGGVVVSFDCSWKPGSVRVPHGSSAYDVTRSGCVASDAEVVTSAGTSYVVEPFTELYRVEALAEVLHVAPAQICVPSRCVFAVPGELPACSDDCAPDHQTRYEVDRSSCSPADLQRVPPGIDAAFALPTHCVDSARPGLTNVGEKWRPCACFDGEPLAPAAEANASVRFACSWPSGKIAVSALQRDSFSPSDARCDPLHRDGPSQSDRFVDAPYVERYEPGEGNATNGLAQHELCVPSVCTFDRPGERARCSSDCSHDGTTRYEVQRDACPDAVPPGAQRTTQPKRR